MLKTCCPFGANYLDEIIHVSEVRPPVVVRKEPKSEEMSRKYDWWSKNSPISGMNINGKHELRQRRSIRLDLVDTGLDLLVGGGQPVGVWNWSSYGTPNAESRDDAIGMKGNRTPP